jgi:serine/threonine protein kinase
MPLYDTKKQKLFSQMYDESTPQRKRPLVESFVKSMFTSADELQACSHVYGSSINEFSMIPKPWQLVHADLKLENLFLDQLTRTIRLGDLDAVAIVQPGGEPRYGTIVTTPEFAPPGTSVIHSSFRRELYN